MHDASHPNSEPNVLMKGYLRRVGKESKLNNEIQAELEIEYQQQRNGNPQTVKLTIS